MTPETIAITILAAYAAIGLGAIAWNIMRSGVSWQAWALYVTERIYVPLMFRWHGDRRCPLPADGPALIIANHRSPVDPLILWMNHHLIDERRRIRLMRFLMAEEYRNVPGVRWITRHMETIPVKRDGSDLSSAREALRLLKSGERVGVFPEGRINTQGRRLLEADTGIAWLALRSETPVYPAFIDGSPQGKAMVACFWTLSRVRVTYGEAINLSEYYGRRKTQDLLREVTERIMQRL
ncbi:MAG: lysophospholipid acyltransferase family protein, partial [Planctomycetaceae bacterium]